MRGAPSKARGGRADYTNRVPLRLRDPQVPRQHSEGERSHYRGGGSQGAALRGGECCCKRTAWKPGGLSLGKPCQANASLTEIIFLLSITSCGSRERYLPFPIANSRQGGTRAWACVLSIRAAGGLAPTAATKRDLPETTAQRGCRTGFSSCHHGILQAQWPRS